MENQTEIKKNTSLLGNKWMKGGLLLIGLLVVGIAIVYWESSGSTIQIDKSSISTSIIGLSPTIPGPLEEVYANEGDIVNAYTPVARVGDELIKTKISGMIISVNKNVGTIFAAGSPVVTMINPSQLRVIGTIEEDKGLEDIKVGQMATFTVDAFKSKKYIGIVDEISSTSHESGVVFTISDKRESKLFDIKVRFNPDKYPELKNGMSAKITIYK
jgi:multidrug resistance efflux pump